MYGRRNSFGMAQGREHGIEGNGGEGGGGGRLDLTMKTLEPSDIG